MMSDSPHISPLETTISNNENQIDSKLQHREPISLDPSEGHHHYPERHHGYNASNGRSKSPYRDPNAGSISTSERYNSPVNQNQTYRNTYLSNGLDSPESVRTLRAMTAMERIREVEFGLKRKQREEDAARKSVRNTLSKSPQTTRHDARQAQLRASREQHVAKKDAMIFGNEKICNQYNASLPSSTSKTVTTTGRGKTAREQNISYRPTKSSFEKASAVGRQCGVWSKNRQERFTFQYGNFEGTVPTYVPSLRYTIGRPGAGRYGKSTSIKNP